VFENTLSVWDTRDCCSAHVSNHSGDLPCLDMRSSVAAPSYPSCGDDMHGIGRALPRLSAIARSFSTSASRNMKARHHQFFRPTYSDPSAFDEGHPGSLQERQLHVRNTRPRAQSPWQTHAFCRYLLIDEASSQAAAVCVPSLASRFARAHLDAAIRSTSLRSRTQRRLLV
jgi:hypothetical protein